MGRGVALGWGVGVGAACDDVQAVKSSKAKLSKILFRGDICYSDTTKRLCYSKCSKENKKRKD